MPLEYTKAMLTAGWILTACTVGLLGEVTTIGARTVLIGVALVPPLTLLLFWNGPSETLMQSIQRARR